MLKIEVIKFEAQDVITASTAAPTEAPEEAKCTCSANDEHYHFANDEVGNLYYDHEGCTYEGEHNCREYEVIN